MIDKKNIKKIKDRNLQDIIISGKSYSINQIKRNTFKEGPGFYEFVEGNSYTYRYNTGTGDLNTYILDNTTNKEQIPAHIVDVSDEYTYTVFYNPTFEES